MTGSFEPAAIPLAILGVGRDDENGGHRPHPASAATRVMSRTSMTPSTARASLAMIAA